MKTAKTHRLLIALLSVLLLIPSFSVAAADEPSDAQAQIRVEPVSVLNPSGNVSFELLDLNMMPSGSSNTVSFTISVENKGSAPLQLINYWVRVRSVSGSSFTVYLHNRYKDVTQVAPGSRQNLTYYSKVSRDLRLDQLVIEMIQWDFDLDNYERSLGRFNVPSSFSNVVQDGFDHFFHISDALIQSSIRGASLNKSNTNYSLNARLEWKNVGSANAVLPAYHFFVKTGSGLMYSLESSDLTENESLYPLVKKEIRLKGEVPVEVDTSEWTLLIAEFDSGNRLYIPVAEYALPSFTSIGSDQVPYGSGFELDVDDETALTKVTQFTRSKNDANFNGTITFSVENIGQNPVQLPGYEFAIRTGDGLTYPIKGDPLANQSINPKEKKEFKLNFTIPSGVTESDWSLILYSSPGQSGKPLSGHMLATYQLPEVAVSRLTVGSEYEYSNEDGTYHFLLDSVQRFPWDDQDILTANVTVINRSKDSKRVIPLSGYFELDDTVKIPFHAIQKDNVIAIGGNASVSYTLYGMIPYTYQYSSLDIVLQDKRSDEQVIDIATYRTDSTVQPLKTLDVYAAHKITGSGRQAEVAVRSVRTYSGTDANLYTVLVDVTNLEKRYANVAKLVGYFKTEDDYMYPAQVTEVTSKVSPLGKATLLLQTSIPKHLDPVEFQLILGEGVQNSQFITSGTPDAYVNPVILKLPSEPDEPSTDLQNLVLFPYTVSLSRLYATYMDVESFAFTFDYELSKNIFVETSVDDHQLLLEFSDLNRDIKFSKTFTLDKADGDSNLKLGSHSATVIIHDPFASYRFQTLSEYRVTVYDVYQGQKKKLAENTFRWYYYSD